MADCLPVNVHRGGGWRGKRETSGGGGVREKGVGGSVDLVVIGTLKQLTVVNCDMHPLLGACIL